MDEPAQDVRPLDPPDSGMHADTVSGPLPRHRDIKIEAPMGTGTVVVRQPGGEQWTHVVLVPPTEKLHPSPRALTAATAVSIPATWSVPNRLASPAAVVDARVVTGSSSCPAVSARRRSSDAR
jgi:hypothetical protein